MELLLFKVFLFIFIVARAQGNVPLVVDVVGQASFQRKGWENFSKIVFGTELIDGDLIKLSPNAKVTVVCTNLTVQTVENRQFFGIGLPCPDEPEHANYKGRKLLSLRDGNKIGIPQILSPRSTVISTDCPTLKWKPVEGALSYTVIFKSLTQGVLWDWYLEGTETQLSFPNTAPPLVENDVYFFEVNAQLPNGKRSSEEEKIPDLGFTLLDKAKLEELNQKLVVIQSFESSYTIKIYTEAQQKISFELYGEAIQMLEAIPESEKLFAAQFKLGELYKAIQLADLAEKHFEKALLLSQEDGNLAGQADGAVNLAVVNASRGKITEAKANYQLALNSYKQLGDSSNVQKVLSNIETLKLGE